MGLPTTAFLDSLYTAYPGIKVYKPLDANEAWRCYFWRRSAANPWRSRARAGHTGSETGRWGRPPAREAVNGAYVCKPFRENGKPKKVLAICAAR